jgi:dipeptidyl aminopeptidase/acylaminoacyl peptidase
VTSAASSTSTSPHRRIAERIIGSVCQAATPVVSPDGRWIAFVVGRVVLEENTTRSQIWLAAADGSTPPQVLTSGPNDAQPRWAPDGSWLAFTSRRSDGKGEATLHVVPIAVPGETRTLATMPDGVSDPQVSPDGRWIAFESRTRHERYGATDESWQAPRKIERFFTKLDNEGWTYDRPSHVYLVPVDGTADPRNLTPGEFECGGARWTPDGAALVIGSARHDTWDLDFASNIHRLALDGTITPITPPTIKHHHPSVSPSGSFVAVLGMDDPSTEPQNAHIGIVDLRSDLPSMARWVSTALDRTFETTAGSRSPLWEDDTTLLATAEDRGETHLYRVFADGRPPAQLTHGPITVKSFDAAGGTIAAAVGSVDGVSDVFVVEGGAMRRITDFADRYRSTVEPLTWERFAVPSTDGTVEIDGWIMRPVEFDASRTYPVLLNVHGGPHTQYGETFFDEAQMQAAAGFVVVMCNPRGSSGREQSWGQAIIGPKHPVAPGTGWGSVDVDDVLAVLDHALDTYPFCDRRRVGMLGGSYGGFMATWFAGRHGDRFGAICSERAVNNMISEEWTSDIGSVFRTEVGLSHLDDPEGYAAFSPVRFVRDITTPMLLIHSENDLRCPISQAEELFMALRLLGKEVVFYRFPGEGHELSRSGSPVHRVQRAEIILDWFAEQLGAS